MSERKPGGGESGDDGGITELDSTSAAVYVNVGHHGIEDVADSRLKHDRLDEIDDGSLQVSVPGTSRAHQGRELVQRLNRLRLRSRIGALRNDELVCEPVTQSPERRRHMGIG